MGCQLLPSRPINQKSQFVKKVKKELGIFKGPMPNVNGTFQNKWIEFTDNDNDVQYRGQWLFQNPNNSQNKAHGFGIYHLKQKFQGSITSSPGNQQQQMYIFATSNNGRIVQDHVRIVYRSDGKDIDYYEGSINNQYHKEGEGMMRMNNMYYEGGWKNDLYEGKGYLCCGQQLVYQGTFEKGMKKYGKLIEPHGVYVGHFVNNVKQGQGEFEWNRGGRYEGSYLNNMQHGSGVLYDSQQVCVRKGNWEMGRMVKEA